MDPQQPRHLRPRAPFAQQFDHLLAQQLRPHLPQKINAPESPGATGGLLRADGALPGVEPRGR
jgi:hypothetical protein